MGVGIGAVGVECEGAVFGGGEWGCVDCERILIRVGVVGEEAGGEDVDGGVLGEGGGIGEGGGRIVDRVDGDLEGAAECQVIAGGV